MLALIRHYEQVFPAYAGMIPNTARCSQHRFGVPRIRGDDPGTDIHYNDNGQCSPHTRG